MKKNRFFKILGCALSLLLVASCTKETTVTLRSFVTKFTNYGTFSLVITEKDHIVMYWYNRTEVLTYDSRGEAKRRFEEVTQRLGDVAYNQRVRFIGSIPCQRYPYNEILSISVVSDTDFCAEHPAGSSLNGLVRFLSVSPIRFIQSGYRETFDWNNACQQTQALMLDETRVFICGRQIHFPVKGKLADLTQEDFLLLGTGDSSPWWPKPGYGTTLPGHFIGYLTFEQTPEISGVHEITVTIHLADGRVLSRSIEKEF